MNSQDWMALKRGSWDSQLQEKAPHDLSDQSPLLHHKSRQQQPDDDPFSSSFDRSFSLWLCLTEMCAAVVSSPLMKVSVFLIIALRASMGHSFILRVHSLSVSEWMIS